MKSRIASAPWTEDPVRFLAELLGGVRESVVATDLEGRVLYWGQGAERLYGWSAAEALGRSITFIVPDSEQDAEHERMRQVLEHGAWQGEYPQVRKDGTTFWADTFISLVTDAAGRPCGFIGIDHDVTRRKRAEEQLRRSERRLRLILETLAEGSWDWNVAAGQAFFSRRWRESLGLAPDGSPDHVDGWLERVHPDDRPRVERALRAHLDGRTPLFECEQRLRTRGGDWRLFLARGRVVERDETGRPQRMVGAHADITERKRGEEALRRQAQLLDQVHDSVITTDLEGRITSWNNGAERIFGYTAEEMIGGHVVQLYPPEERGALEERVLGPLRAKGQHDVELRNRRKSGEDCWIHLSLSWLRDSAGKPCGMIGYAMDITEHRRAEEERRRVERRLAERQKLESLGVLAGGIAHDFNNLLTGILGNASLAATRLPAESPAATSLARIEKAALRAADLCKQMLAYSGRGHFVMERCDLSELVRETTELLRLSISKNATLELDLGGGLPAVLADPTQLRQIVMNLVTNASDAVAETGGRIRVATVLRAFDAEELAACHTAVSLSSGPFVVLEVADDGCGMSGETRHRIFDPFFTTKFAGRGLGLAAVLGIVRGHGGAMLVDSAPGRGSRFTLLLPPAAGPLERPPVRSPGIPAWRGRGAVLVVDDEECVRVVARELLEEQGFDVLLASDGEQALETFAAHAERIRLVLLDLTMPRMDGERTYRELCRRWPDACVALMSGYSGQEVHERLLDVAPALFLQKPFAREDLLALLHELLAPSRSD